MAEDKLGIFGDVADVAPPKEEPPKEEKGSDLGFFADVPDLPKQVSVLGGKLAGKEDVFIEAGLRHDVDPKLLMAMSMFETGDGTSHMIRTKNNVGGLTEPGNPNTYRTFKSVDDSIETMAKTVRRGYLDKGLTTIQQIGAKYAPPGASNDPNRTNTEWPSAVAHNYQRLSSSEIQRRIAEFPTIAGKETGEAVKAVGGDVPLGIFGDLPDVPGAKSEGKPEKAAPSAAAAPSEDLGLFSDIPTVQAPAAPAEAEVSEPPPAALPPEQPEEAPPETPMFPAQTVETPPRAAEEPPGGLFYSKAGVTPAAAEAQSPIAGPELTNAVEAATETITDMFPHSAEQISQMSGLPRDWSNPLEVAKFATGRAFPQAMVLPQITQQALARVEQIGEAEKTPAFSKERFKAGFGTVADLIMAAQIGGAAGTAVRTAGRAAALAKPPPIPAHLLERRFTMVPPRVAREVPGAPSKGVPAAKAPPTTPVVPTPKTETVPQTPTAPTFVAGEKPTKAGGKAAKRAFRQATDTFGFSAETPVASYVNENGGLISKSAAKKAGKLKGNQALWDDLPKLSHPTHNKIWDPGGEMPDVMASNLYDAGLIKEPTVDAMYRALEQESKTARQAVKQGAVPEGFTTKESQQGRAFGAQQSEAARGGATPHQIVDLSVGDKIKVDGQVMEVTGFNPETMTYEFKDGSEFGVQHMGPGEIIYGELEQAAPGAPKPVTPSQFVTSTKNVVTALERHARGEPQIELEAARKNPDIWKQSDDVMRQDPMVGKRMVGQILTGEKTSVSPLDEAILLREKINTQNARASHARVLEDPLASDADKRFASQEFDILEAHSTAIDQATYKQGRIWGEFGRFRQQLAAQDYSLLNLETRLRSAKGGKPITPEESRLLRERSEQVDKLQKRIDARTQRLEDSVARAKGLLPPKGKPEALPLNTEQEILQTELKALRAQEREAGRLPAAKERAQKRIGILEDRLKEIGAMKEVRPPKIAADNELLKLKYQLFQTTQKIEEQIWKAKLKSLPLPQRVRSTVREVWNVSRNLKASSDLSAFRRQGGLFTVSHPLRAMRSFGPALKAARNEKGYFEVMEGIRNRANAHEYKAFDLGLTDVYARDLTKMEELFRGRWSEKIPLIKHSNRAYTAQLNTMRADWYDLLRDNLVGDGPITPEQGKAIANAVNVWTGRGPLGSWAAAGDMLSDVFFAPRYRFSRFQTLIGQPLWNARGSRKILAMEYGRIIAGQGALLGITNYANYLLTGEGPNLDPLSSDFGKLKLGPTRIDLNYGLAQATVLLARTIAGMKTTQAGETVPTRGADLGYGKQTGADIAVRYLRGGLAPIPGAFWNSLAGTNFMGEPITLGNQAKDLLMPLSWSDLVDASIAQGVPKGAALGLISMLGDGVQTYSLRATNTPNGLMIAPPPPPPPPPPAAPPPPPPLR
jgi:hypothetical protein